MTYLLNSASDFSHEAVLGFAAANSQYVTAVHGGVVRSTQTPAGQPALVIGGGSGHYPAFAGWVGPGMGHGAPCGNIFSSPSASQVYSVARNAENGGGVLMGFGNYAGDVLHFGAAAEKLRAEGIDVRIIRVSDDIASNSRKNHRDRRGIAGDLPVFKIAGAAIEAGADLDEAERIAWNANDATRSFGLAFDGCTLPGAEEPLFHVEEGTMGVGLGIAFAIPLSVLIIVNFVRDIPAELFESMKVDGAGEWRILTSLVLPMAKPALMTVGIYQALQVWNSFLFPLVLTQSSEVRVLPLSLWEYSGQFGIDVPATLAAVVLSALPLLIAYIFARRHIVAGLTAGFGK